MFLSVAYVSILYLINGGKYQQVFIYVYFGLLFIVIYLSKHIKILFYLYIPIV